MQRDVSEYFPRPIEVRARGGHRERRIIVVDTITNHCSHTGCFFAHPIAGKVGAGFAGHVEHERFHAGIAGADILDPAANKESGRDRLAALAPLHQNF